MSVFLFIVVIVLLFIIALTQNSYRKNLAKVKADGYMEGWMKASETLSDFDINTWIDGKLGKNGR